MCWSGPLFRGAARAAISADPQLACRQAVASIDPPRVPGPIVGGLRPRRQLSRRRSPLDGRWWRAGTRESARTTSPRHARPRQRRCLVRARSGSRRGSPRTASVAQIAAMLTRGNDPIVSMPEITAAASTSPREARINSAPSRDPATIGRSALAWLSLTASPRRRIADPGSPSRFKMSAELINEPGRTDFAAPLRASAMLSS